MAADPHARQSLSQRLLQLPAAQRAVFCRTLSEKGVSLSALPIVPVESVRAERARVPLAPAQQRLWFLHQLGEGRDTAYNICVALRLQGALDAGALKKALEALLRRHEALRTAIVEHDGLAWQQVLDDVTLDWSWTDLTDSVDRGTDADAHARLRSIGETLTATPFDLRRPPLLRAHLVRLGAIEHQLWLAAHHIAVDGWSLQLLMRELGALYGGAAALEPLPIRYADYAYWQHEVLLAHGAYDEQLHYWERQLGTEHPVLSLPTDRPRPAHASMRGAVHAQRLGATLVGGLRTLGRQARATPFMVMLAAFQLLLWRLSGQSEVRVGTPVSNRERAETQALVGMLANTVVLRAAPQAGDSFAGLLSETARAVAEAQSRQDVPFERLVDALQVPRELAHTPLFQAMLVFNDAGSALALGDVVATALPTPRNHAKFELTLEVTEDGAELSLAWIYAADLFEATTMARYAQRFERLLRSIVEQPHGRVEALALLAPDETRWLLDQWNDTGRARAHAGWVHELIERQVDRTPEGMALIVDGLSVCYRDLDERANRLAHALRAQGVRPDAVVGVCLPRSAEMVVALLGVMKCGAAYLPLDPDYPQERLDYMASDAGIRVLLTHSATPRLPQAPGLRVWALDDADSAAARHPCSRLSVRVHGAQLAYVIYTSGSTGRPKGVGVPHEGLLNRLQWMQDAYGLTPADRVLQKTPFSFDVSVWEFFWPLMTGATLVVAAPGAHRDSEQLAATIRGHGVTTLHFVPSMLRAFLDDPASTSCGSVRRIICSGEALAFDLQQRCHERLPAAELHNLYGPTEASIDVSHWHCRHGSADRVVPIGRPIDNITLHVLDAALKPAPLGVGGELHIGGIGLARAYLGKPALTAERFVPDPCGATPGSRLYRTGDLARWRNDGSIEYLGRLDHQVKIRGFRIELGEIEARLLSHPGVAAAAVVAREDRPGDKRLAAYWVARESSEAEGWSPVSDDESLRSHLAAVLPEHMQPSAWVRLTCLPISPNGKLDRKRLPAPEDRQSVEATAGPRNPTEQALLAIWQSVLGTSSFGVHDNFFRLGGDSILSLQVVARARERGLRLTPRQMFEHQTVARLASVVEVLEPSPAAALDPFPERAPLTPIQHWFFDAGFRHPAHWNQAVVLVLHRRLHPEMLEQALAAVVSHHAALSLRFDPEERRQCPGAASRRAPLLQCVDLRDVADDRWPAALAAEGQRLQSSFDLARGELCVAALFEAGGSRPQRLLLAVHHLAVDGVSWRILLADLAQALSQLIQGDRVQLPPASTPYLEWAWRLARHAEEPATLAERPYWQAVAETPPLFPGLEAGALHESCRQRVRLDRRRTDLLLGDGPARLRASVEDVLLTALAQTLCAVTRRQDVVIELEGHGREDLFEGVDLTRTVGWFTSRFPLRLVLPVAGPIEQIKSVKEQRRELPRRGLGYGLLRRQLPGTWSPQVCFNYLGRFERGFASGGLFSLADERPGDTRHREERRTHVLDVDAQVLDGELDLELTLAPALEDLLQGQTAPGGLAQAYLQVLEALLEALESTSAGVTPSDLPQSGLGQAALDALELDWARLEDLHPVTPMQQGMLAEADLGRGPATYVLQECYRLDGPVDSQLFSAAWAQVFERHPALRSSFVLRAGQTPLQAVWSAPPGMVSIVSWADRDAAQQASALERLLRDEREQFDLTRPPLSRVRLLRTGEQAHVLVFSCHHLLLDAWSYSLLVGEFATIYRAGLRGEPSSLPAALPFVRYVAWLGSQDPRASEAWWRAQLQTCSERTPLPLPGPTVSGPRGGDTLALMLGAAESRRLVQAAQAHGLTPHTLAQGAWAWLLASGTGRVEVVFGMTVAGRPTELRGAERSVGLYINTLPMRARWQPGASALEWMRGLQATAAEARQHQHLPLWRIQAQSPLGAGQALFDTLLVFENTPVDEGLRDDPLPFKFERMGGHSATHFALTVAVTPGSQWRLELAADPERVETRRLPFLLAAFRAALLSLADGLDRPLGRLSMADRVPPVDPASSVSTAHATADAECGSDPLLPQALARACERWSTRTALELGDERLTYGELGRRVDAKARRLRVLGVSAERRVGLCMERSLDLAVSLWAIWRAGGVAVVLDATWPEQRLADIASDAGLVLLLSDPERAPLARRVAPAGVTVLTPEAWVVRASPAAVGAARPHAELRPEQLAYLIYTSGSTGRPKAVAVPHGALAAHAHSMAAVLGLEAEDRMLQFSTLAFDASLDQLVPPLLCGAAVVMRGAALWDAADLHRQLRERRITVADLPTSYALQMLGEWPAGLGADCTELRLLSVGGEALPADAWQTWRAAGLAHARLLNAYGPTEAVVTAAVQDCHADQPTDAYWPIGRATPGRALHVLDPWLQPVVAGLVGELYIGGALLARGYLDRPGLSAERFVPDPFGEAGARLYRTGDLVSQRADGSLAYRGRVDQQLKLRGHRVEAGEIEACLRALPGVREAAVVVRHDRAQASGHDGVSARLVAYVVGRTPSEDDMLATLAQRLPAPLCPSNILQLSALPLTPSGKLDRAALPAPPPRPTVADTEPLTDVERRLAAVWGELLGLAHPARSDHFFRSGGDSILALQLVGRLRREGLQLRPQDVFDHPTLGELSRAAAHGAVPHPRGMSDGGTGAPRTDERPTGAVPLSPIQSWLLEQPLVRPQHWNQSVLLHADSDLDAAALERALQALVDHHDALRLVFEPDDAAGGWKQRYADRIPMSLQRHRVTDAGALQLVCTEAQAGLDLAQAAIAAALIDLPDGSQRLLLAAHHLVVDGVSWRLLLEDLDRAYEQAVSGDAIALAPRTSSYRAWVEGLQAYARGPAAQSELQGWQQLLRDAKPLCTGALPALGAMHSLEVSLDARTTTRLLTEVHHAYRTEVPDLLLAALGQSLGAYLGQTQVLVELEGHGREHLPGMEDGLDLSRTVGWFTSRFPVLLSTAPDAAHVLVEIKERLRRVPHKGVGWSAIERLGLPAAQATARALPRAGIAFNYLGRWTEPRAGGRWRLAGEPPGRGVDARNPSTHEIEVDAIVRDGKLRLSWRYSPLHHLEAEIAAVASAHLERLRTLVDHAAAATPRVTASDFPLARLPLRGLDSLAAVLQGSQRLEDVEDIYPLSPMQQGMLFHAMCRSAEDVYLNQLHCRVEGTVDRSAFEAAWQQSIGRHAILRTSFWWQREGEPLQVVWRDASLSLLVHAWRDHTLEEYEAELTKLLHADRQRGLDLGRAPAMRLQWIEGPAGRTDLIWTCHHLLLDGWSSERLVSEVLHRYRALCSGSALPAAPPPRPYRDYIAWLLRNDAAATERHWRERLASLSAPLLLADCVAADGERAAGMAERQVTLSPGDTARLYASARAAGITPSAAVQAAWAMLLSRYCSRSDVAYGLTLVGRPDDLPGCEDTIGLFINTVPVVVQVHSAHSIDAVAQQLHAQHQTLRPACAATPLAEIQRWSFGAAQPLFDTLLVFETTGADRQPPALQDGSLRLTVAERIDRTSYPLTLNVSLADRLAIEFSHDRARLSPGQLLRIAEQLLGLLRSFGRGVPMADLPMLCDAERRQLAAWNDTGDGAGIPCDPYRVFEQQAERTPRAVAVRCGGTSLTYAALRQHAEAAGDALLALGVGLDDVVALCDVRGPDLLVLMLATLRAGAAYLPLAPEQPTQRLQHLLALSGVRWVLCGAGVEPSLQTALAALPAVRCHTLQTLLQRPVERPQRSRGAHPLALAYVIYTSGSTGTPKGAMVERRGLMNNLLQKHAQLGLVAGDVVAQTAPATFDISVWQFLSPLLCGATVDILSDAQVRDPAALWAAVRERGVTVLEVVPGLLQALMDEPQRGALPLRWVLPTGEALPPALANQWLAAYPGVPLLNVYGPAECADDVSLHALRSPLPTDCAHAPIGRPVAHLRLQVMSPDLQPLPVAVSGELCVAGAGVGRGYLGDPVRTAAAFVPDPCAPRPGERLYCTGDIARRREDGVLEYLGRRDQQIKLRGHRIELGEIEAALERHAGVERAACVLQRGDAGRPDALVAFVVANRELDLQGLRSALEQLLPAYMVPQRLERLSSMPLNANGKVDRLALPHLDTGAVASGVLYAAAASPLEALLESVWSEALGLSRIGVHDNFFLSGGHSLLAVRVMQRTRQLLQRDIALTLIFQAPTIAALARELSTSGVQGSPLIELRSGRGPALYCVHPAGGHVASYLPLVQALPPSQAIYGLQSRSLHDPHWQNVSIEAMARDYVTEIRTVQARGPYRLLGWSMGGALAMAMAAEFEAQGDTVDWIGLIDAVHARHDESAVRADHAAECIDYLKGLVRSAAEQADLAELHGRLETLNDADPLEVAVRWARDRALLPVDMDVSEVRLRLEARYESARLMRAHRPQRVRAAVHVWQAEETVRDSGERELSWAPYAGHLHVYPPVDGDHLDIVRSPALAAELGRLLTAEQAFPPAMEN